MNKMVDGKIVAMSLEEITAREEEESKEMENLHNGAQSATEMAIKSNSALCAIIDVLAERFQISRTQLMGDILTKAASR